MKTALLSLAVLLAACDPRVSIGDPDAGTPDAGTGGVQVLGGCPRVSLGRSTSVEYSADTSTLENIVISNRLEWTDAPDDSLEFTAAQAGTYAIDLTSTNASLGVSAKNKRKNPGNREPNLVTEARVGGAEVRSTRVSVAVFCRGEWAQECCGHTGRATAKSARSERWPSHRERQLRRCGGWRQHPRGQGDAELGEAGFGVLAGGMEAPDGAPSATGATQDVGAEGALVKLGPVEAGPLWFRRG
jgi:hypothetical protein